MRSGSQLVLGIIIVVIGALFLLDNLNIIYMGDVFRYWPVLVVALGLSRMIGSVGSVGRFVGFVIAGFGVLLLMDNLYLIDFRFWQWWPMILILIGGSILFSSRGKTVKPAVGSPSVVVSPDSTLSLFAFMSGFKRTVTSDDFRAGDVTAIMGGCEIDLRQASIKSGLSTISCFAFWGGIEIRVPTDWTVSVQGMPLLGGFDDKTHQIQPSPEKHLIITGQAIMGGVEIKN